jgi:hypothetical protein
MNQCGRLESVARSFVGQPCSRQYPQFVVDQRQQLRGRVRVAGFDARQDACNFVHGRHQGACNSRRKAPAQLRERVRESLIFARVYPDEQSGLFPPHYG